MEELKGSVEQYREFCCSEESRHRPENAPDATASAEVKKVPSSAIVPEVAVHSVGFSSDCDQSCHRLEGYSSSYP